MDVSDRYAQDADEFKNSMELIQASISELTAAMKQISRRVAEITQNTNECSTSITGIAERTSQMTEVTIENAHQAESSKSSLEELTAVINKITL